MVTYAERPWLANYGSVPRTLEPYPATTMHGLLQQAVQQYPTKPALVTSNRLPRSLGRLGRLSTTMTYAELDQASDALAAALVQMGVQKGDRVAIVMPNVTAFVVAYYAISKAGGVIVATNPTYPVEKMKLQLNDSDAKVVICLSLFYNTVKQAQPGTKVKQVIVANVKEYFHPVVRTLFTLTRERKDGHKVAQLAEGDVWYQDLLRRHAGQKANVNVTPEDLAIFQYTGGTTGNSKAAMSPHRALVANALQCRAYLGGGQNGDSFLAAIPLFHVFGMVAVLNFAVAMGATMYLVPNARDLDDTLDTITVFKPTLFQGVPALYGALINHPKVKSGEYDVKSIRVCVAGSAPLPPAVKREFERITGGKLLEGYGMSEAPTATHCNPVDGENRAGSVGMPLPDIDCRIVSLEDGETDMPVGEVGEIVIGGPTVMMGYHNMPDETREAIREQHGKRWFFTGDIGKMDEDGYFYIVDRKKDMAILGGFNVYPTQIEKVLTDHEAVAEAAVAAIPHPEKEGQEALKAWIVLKPGKSATPEELIRYCETRLAMYEVPRRYAFVTELPKSYVGKTLRRLLVEEERTGVRPPVTV